MRRAFALTLTTALLLSLSDSLFRGMPGTDQYHATRNPNAEGSYAFPEKALPDGTWVR